MFIQTLTKLVAAFIRMSNSKGKGRRLCHNTPGEVGARTVDKCLPECAPQIGITQLQQLQPLSSAETSQLVKQGLDVAGGVSRSMFWFCGWTWSASLIAPDGSAQSWRPSSQQRGCVEHQVETGAARPS